ncbi:MAG: hypothetical protein DRI61_12615 [Chloroflexi bacterium]|nr:MAG: hypothetical protein DRI61_12615 [Chloroflexota bacterium]
MATVQVRSSYISVLERLGDVQTGVEEAIRRYTVEEVQRRIAELRARIRKWEEKYGCDYETFALRTATDEKYVARLNSEPETQQWEADLFSWEYDLQELREWEQQLQSILSASLSDAKASLTR